MTTLPSTSGPCSIQLISFYEQDYANNGLVGFRLYIMAVNPVNMPAEVFRYFSEPPDPATGAVNSNFSGICTWPDLEAYPANTPRSTDNPPVFRLNYVDVVTDTQAQAQQIQQLVTSDVQTLVSTINAGQTMLQTDSVVIS